MLFMRYLVQYANALIIVVLGSILTAAYMMQLQIGANECVYCMLQRLAMIGVAMGEMLNLRYGMRSSHYALAYFSALFGASVSLKQMSFYIGADAPSYPIKVFGLELFVWALIVFVCVMVAVCILYFLTLAAKEPNEKHHVPLIGIIAIGFIMIITFCNILV